LQELVCQMQNPSRQDHKVVLCFFVAEGNQPNIWNNICFMWECLYQRLWWWSGIGHSCSLTWTGVECIQSIHAQTTQFVWYCAQLFIWDLGKMCSEWVQSQGAGCINIAQILAVLPSRAQCVL